MTDRKLYVVGNTTSAQITPVTVPAGTVGSSTTSPLGSTWTAAIRPQGDYVYFTDGDNVALAEYRVSDGVVTATVSIGSSDYVTVSPDGTRAYVIGKGGGQTLRYYTLPGLGTGSTFGTQGSNDQDIAISPDGTTAYVTDYNSGCVYKFSTSSTAVTTLNNLLTNPAGIAISPDGTILLVGTYFGQVYVVSTSTGSILKTLTVGSTPWSVGISSLGVGVANDGTTGQAWIITPLNASAVATLATGSGPAADVPHPATSPRPAISTDGSIAYIADNRRYVYPLNIGTGEWGTPIDMGSGYAPFALAVSPPSGPGGWAQDEWAQTVGWS